jgi:hypothetical protein
MEYWNILSIHYFVSAVHVCPTVYIYYQKQSLMCVVLSFIVRQKDGGCLLLAQMAVLQLILQIQSNAFWFQYTSSTLNYWYNDSNKEYRF